MKQLIKSFKGKEFIFNFPDEQADALLKKDKRYREVEKKVFTAPKREKKIETEEV